MLAISPTPRDLDALAQTIRTAHQGVAAAVSDMLGAAFEAGEALLKAKAKVGHGCWLGWLKTECDLRERTAERYMRLARGRKERAVRPGARCRWIFKPAGGRWQGGADPTLVVDAITQRLVTGFRTGFLDGSAPVEVLSSELRDLRQGPDRPGIHGAMDRPRMRGHVVTACAVRDRRQQPSASGLDRGKPCNAISVVTKMLEVNLSRISLAQGDVAYAHERCIKQHNKMAEKATSRVRCLVGRGLRE